MPKREQILFALANIILILILGFVFIAMPAHAHAATIVGQTDYSVSQLGSPDGDGRFQTTQRIGNGLSGVWDAYRIKVSGTITSGTLIVYMQCFTDSSYTTGCATPTYQFGLNSGATHISTYYDAGTNFETVTGLTGNLSTNGGSTFNSTLTFNPADYYAITVYNNNGANDIYSYGSAGAGAFYHEEENGIGGAHTAAFYSLGFEIADAGGFTPSNLNTSINITNPTNGTTTASTTFDINADYAIGTDLSSFSTDGSLPNNIGIKFTMVGSHGNQIDMGTDFTISTTTGTHTYATTTTVAQDTYSIVGSLVGDYGFTPAPTDCTPILPFVTCTGSGNLNTLVTNIVGQVSINNGIIPVLGFIPGDNEGQNALATTTCNAFALGGCFQNALAFLFYPSPDILDQFQFLWSLIKNKPPFGYVSQTITSLKNINASSTPTFSFGNIPLIDAIFTPFRTGLAAILWLGFFIAWYRGRLRHLDI